MTGSGPAQFGAMLEGDSFDTFNQGSGIGSSVSQFNDDLDLSHFHSGTHR